VNRPSELFLAVLLSFLLVATFNVRGVVAEPPTEGWARTYGGTGSEMARSMVQTSDGGYAIAGITGSYGTGGEDFWLVKTDSNGNALWNKTYGRTGQDWAYSMVQTVDGGYAIAGGTNSYGAGDSDFWLVKVNANGNALWNQTYGGTGQDEAHSVVQTADGGYAIAGHTFSYPYGAGNADFWLVKTDLNGNALWNKTYGRTEIDEAYSIIQTSDGGYALAGKTNSYDTGNSDFWLVKIDANGNALWNQTYGGTDTDAAFSIVQTSDGGYAIAGYTYSYGAGNADFWLVKTDSNGNALWNKTYGGTVTEMTWSMVKTADGGYALAGVTTSYGAGYSDFWLVKTDLNGNALWNKTYGGTGSDEAHSVVQTVDGGYALAGYTGSYGAGGSDFWLVKVDALGFIPEFRSVVLMITVTLTTVLMKKKFRASMTSARHT
jgi:hypothetical protein